MDGITLKPLLSWVRRGRGLRGRRPTAAERLIADVADKVDMARYEDPPATGHHQLLRLAAEARGIDFIEHNDACIGLYGERAVFSLERTHAAPSTSLIAAPITRSKRLQLHLLRMAGVPIPEGRIFRLDESKEAIEYAARLGWPVVLKPSGLHGGLGVVIGIRSDDEFRSGWQYVLSAITEDGTRDREVIVEREHDGVDLRVYVVAGQAVAGNVKLPPYVRGDGRSTVDALVEEANQERLAHPYLRGKPIVLDAETDRHLALQALSRESVPAQHRVVLLRRIANLSLGSQNVDVTDRLPAAAVEMAVRALGAIPGLDAGAVDLRVHDIRTGKGAVVLEVNRNANISAHHFPVLGEPRDVAGAIVERCLSLFSYEGR
jgi:cyanophycin synthetase